jgi:hypothetical protein
MDDYWDAPPRSTRDEMVTANPVGATHRTLAARRRRRRWVTGLWALVVVVVALTALTVARRVHLSGGATHGSSSTTRTGPTSSSTSVAAPGAPVITSLTPSQGAVGQVVGIAGSNLMSADGQVLAHFGDVVAPTSCPSSTSCSATVPSPSSPTAPVEVTVSTQAGTSNALPFTYR